MISDENQSCATTFGYLSAVYTEEHGYFGGYLIINAMGRPLEFHCTSPVQPSRAHEILYGPTLEQFVVGEQIGQSLLKAAKLTPRLILTDQPAMLAIRAQAAVPMAMLPRKKDEADDSLTEGTAKQTEFHAVSNCDPSEPIGLSQCSRERSQHDFQLPSGYDSSERALASELMSILAAQVDLQEPFSRIYAAIREAQRVGATTQEGHGQAA